ncbi:MAG: NusG domain II-containing protein [Proteobacteria bacterium]|nr:NusG domain II-containing protein [Pseudomonadota bacterium]
MTPWDKLLIVILLILSLASYVTIRSLFPHDTDKVALIELNGKEVMRLSLDPKIPPRQRSLKLDKGEAVFDVSRGKIRILPMDDKLCAKHICSKTGWIEKPWQMIVCLPNKISVRIIGRKKDGEVDLITK